MENDKHVICVVLDDGTVNEFDMTQVSTPSDIRALVTLVLAFVKEAENKGAKIDYWYNMADRGEAEAESVDDAGEKKKRPPRRFGKSYRVPSDPAVGDTFVVDNTGTDTFAKVYNSAWQLLAYVEPGKKLLYTADDDGIWKPTHYE